MAATTTSYSGWMQQNPEIVNQAMANNGSQPMAAPAVQAQPAPELQAPPVPSTGSVEQPQTWDSREIVQPVGAQAVTNAPKAPSTGGQSTLSTMGKISDMAGSDAPDQSGRRATGLSAKTILAKAMRIVGAIYTGGASEIGIQAAQGGGQSEAPNG